MEKMTNPHWLRVYLRTYGILHILIATLMALFLNFGGLIGVLPLFMGAAGIAALIERRWSIIPIGLLTFIFTLVTALGLIAVLAEIIDHRSYIGNAFTDLLGLLGVGLLMAVQWFTVITYRKYLRRIKHVD